MNASNWAHEAVRVMLERIRLSVVNEYLRRAHELRVPASGVE